MELNFFSIPVLFMSGICFYVGMYHFWFFIKKINRMMNISFASSCFIIAFYDVFCVGLYNSDSFVQSMFWARLQLAFLALLAIAIPWFVYYFTKAKSKTFFVFCTIIFLAFFFLGITIRNEMTFSLENAVPKTIQLWHFPQITYYEANLGVFYTIQLISMSLAYCYLIFLLIQYYRKNRKKPSIYIIAALLLFYIATINDSMIASATYSFIYVLEYAFLLIVISMAYAIFNQFVNLYTEVEELNRDLGKKVEERTRELENAHKRLVEAAHIAGKAEIASFILHNVGNLLNGITTNAGLLAQDAKDSAITKLKQANSMIRDNWERINTFIVEDNNGVKLLEYYLMVEDALENEREQQKKNLNDLSKNVSKITKIIEKQRVYVDVPLVTESFMLEDVVDKVIQLNAPMLNRLEIKVIRNFEELPIVNLPKTKLIHVLNSLLENSIEALLENNSMTRTIEFHIKQIDSLAMLSIRDNGSGIEEKNLKSIFFFGYSTKTESDGFGLHGAANFIGEMGGSIKAESEGLGNGATFTIQLPL